MLSFHYKIQRTSRRSLELDSHLLITSFGEYSHERAMLYKKSVRMQHCPIQVHSRSPTINESKKKNGCTEKTVDPLNYCDRANLSHKTKIESFFTQFLSKTLANVQVKESSSYFVTQEASELNRSIVGPYWINYFFLYFSRCRCLYPSNYKLTLLYKSEFIFRPFFSCVPFCLYITLVAHLDQV